MHFYVISFCCWALAVIVSSTTFSYTGGQQTYVVPAGTLSLDVTACGASGTDRSATYLGGNGGCITCTLSVGVGTTLYVFVGDTAGYDGGGAGNSGGVNTNGGGMAIG